MKKIIRLLISIVLMLGLVLVARNQVANAQLSAGSEPSISAEDPSSIALNGLAHDDDDDDDDDHGGTVKPPPGKTKICKKGVYSVGGGATIKVTTLAKHYCIRADLKKRSRVNGHLPDGSGKLLSDVVFVQVLYKNHVVSRLPDPNKGGEAQICFAVPPGKHATIYFLNNFGKKDGKPTWSPIATRVKNGVACAEAELTGAYALIGR
jgi:hypothetical protein